MYQAAVSVQRRAVFTLALALYESSQSNVGPARLGTFPVEKRVGTYKILPWYANTIEIHFGVGKYRTPIFQRLGKRGAKIGIPRNLAYLSEFQSWPDFNV